MENLNFHAEAGGYFSGALIYPDGGSNPSNPNSTVADIGNLIVFQNNTAAGGTGNDTIIGSDVLNLSGLDSFLAGGRHGMIDWMNNLVGGGISNVLQPGSGSLNQILFGDDLLTGGGGNDQFVFTLLPGEHNGHDVVANQGNDRITDFDAHGAFDKLVLHTSLIGQHTAAALDHTAIFSTVGNDTTIAFNDAGSIVLHDSAEHFTSFVSMGAHLLVM